MERRTFITLLAGTPVAAVVAAACGSDSDGASGTPGDLADDGSALPEPSAPGSSAPETSAPGTVDPEDVELVLEYGNYGGFSTIDISFQMQPNLYVTSDNRVFTPGVMPAIFPGPLVPSLFVQTITPAGVETMLAAARDAGLFAEIDYEADTMIADAGTATLRINADGETFVHEAYALGIGGPPGTEEELTPERAALADFLERLSDLAGLVGASELGPQEPFEPTSYQMIVRPAGDLSGSEIEPTLVEWPADTGVVLAETAGCVEIEREAVGTLFDEADQLTFFTEGGEPYAVIVRPTLPARDC